MPRPCAYCDTGQGTTEDHIPPRSLYSKPGPPRPPKVWACEACNQGASADDEYFRDTVLKYHAVSDKPLAAKQIAAMLRAIGNPRKTGYANATLRAFTEIPVSTPAGLYLGHAAAFRVDAERLEREVVRIIKGLHYWELAARFPLGYRVQAILNPDAMAGMQGLLGELFRPADLRVVQEGVFWYAWRRTGDNPDATAWLLSFLDAYAVFALVTNRKEDGAA